MVSEVEEYIFSQSDKSRDIMLYFHDLFVKKFHLRPKLNYNIPFYYGNRWICYLSPIKNNGVDLSFIKGYKMNNHPDYLVSKGRKMVKSASFYHLDEIDESEVIQMLNEALFIDQGL